MSGERRTLRLSAIAVAALLAFGGCGGDDGDDDTSASAVEETTTAEEQESTTTTTAASTTTTTAPTTTTTTAPPVNSETAVLADYRAGWDGYLAALTANPPNPDSPTLLNLYRDGALQRSRDLIAVTRDKGWIVRGGVELRPKLQSLDGSQAVIYDCFIDNTEAIEPSTGAVTGPAGGPSPTEFRLRLEGDRWRTYDNIIREDLRGSMCG